MSDNATMKNTTIHDMTTGSPARLIMQFMIPMFLGNIFQQFYNIADSIIAGQFLGVRALAAIGSTGSLMFFVTGWLNGLSSGFAYFGVTVGLVRKNMRGCGIMWRCLFTFLLAGLCL